MFNFHKDHKSLVSTALLGFLSLSFLIALVPAYQMQDVGPLPDQPRLTEDERKGLHLYISEGCVACHTQQVRNIEMDQVWGKRPSIPSDYYYSKQRMDFWRQSPSLLGSERTGPDLTNVGERQPDRGWHLLHLYNPRTVVEESVMPAYPWLFNVKETGRITAGDVVVPVSEEFFKQPGRKIVATGKALQLVAYLQSLKQASLSGSPGPGFIPSTKKEEDKSQDEGQAANLPDGEKLYMQNCAACHQPDGQGLPGAFPPLAGSAVVNDEDHELMVEIMLQGYDARREYGQMPGFAGQLTDEEIAAIANHERTSWGNKASAISTEDVRKIREYITPVN